MRLFHRIALGLKRLTGIKDFANLGPQLTDASELPRGRSECEYLGLGFALDEQLTRDGFTSTRDSQVKHGTKIEAIPELGDEAYYGWDPKPGANRQVGITFRSGTRRVTLMDMAHADSMPPAKTTLLKVARYLAPRVRR